MIHSWDRRQTKKTGKQRARPKKTVSPTIARGSSEEVVFLGIVCGVGRDAFFVLCDSKTFSCSRADAGPDDLVVGDHVHVIIVGVETVKVVGRVARVSVLTRMRGDRTRKESGALETHVIAANVHVGVIVCSAKQPDFHPHFIDRFLVALQVGGIAPIICINKSDLGSVLVDVQHLYAGLDFPIVEISVRTGYGIEKLKTLLHAKSTVFLGQSGVGKSSLVQTFVPRTMIEVGLVSAKRGTGKHTTTASSLYQWEKDSFVIDTPGIRSLGVEDIPKNQLRFFFPEFADVADSCKFRDCIHLEEPHCGVKKAVEEGLVRKARYESYCRLLEG